VSGRLPGLRAAVALGATVVLVGIGSTVGFAAWTATTAKDATVTAASTGLASTGLSVLATTYKPGLAGVAPAMLTDTAPVTVTNTGSTPLGYGLASAGGNAALNASITLQVWKAGATCDATTTPAAGATSGSLAAPPALPADANAAAVGATVSLCLRTTISAANHSTFAGTSTQPTVSVVGSVGNWTTSTAVAFTQTVGFTWFALVHDLSGKCVASAGTTVAVGTPVVLATCKPLATTSNQAFRFAAVSGTANQRIYLGAGAASGPVLAAATANTGAAVQLAGVETGNSVGSNNQQWSVVQHGDPLDFRIVLKGSNVFAQNSLCLTATAAADGTAFTATSCGLSTANTNATYRAQHFAFTEVP